MELLFWHTHGFSEDQCVLHEVHWVGGGRGNVKEMSFSQSSVDRVIQHPGGDAVETHHVCQCAIITLCVRKGRESLINYCSIIGVFFGEDSFSLSEEIKNRNWQIVMSDLHNIGVNHIPPW